MEAKKYQSVDTYKGAADALYAVGGMVLFCFARHDCDTKNTIIRNFIARSSMTTKSIFQLWEAGDYQNAWVVYRALLDRMFHLSSIASNEEFSEFEEWSFFEQFNAQNRVKSDPEFKHEAVGLIYQLTSLQKARIKELSKNKPIWRRPKAETVAKEMGMEFLYKYGYDYASMHVHPMADDGHQDFYTITKLEPAPSFPSQISLLSNTVLASSIILQDALNHSSFKWRKVLWDFIDKLRQLLNTGDMSYQESFVRLAELFKEESLCEPCQA